MGKDYPVLQWLAEEIAFATGTHPRQVAASVQPPTPAENTTVPEGEPNAEPSNNPIDDMPDEDDFPVVEPDGLKMMAPRFSPVAGSDDPEHIDFRFVPKGRLRYDSDWLDRGLKDKDVTFEQAIQDYRSRIRNYSVQAGPSGVPIHAADKFKALIGPTRKSLEEIARRPDAIRAALDSGEVISVPFGGRVFKRPDWYKPYCYIVHYRTGTGVMGGSEICLSDHKNQTASGFIDSVEAINSDYYFQRGYLRIKNPRWDSIKLSANEGIQQIRMRPNMRVKLWFTSKRKNIIPESKVEGVLGSVASDVGGWVWDTAGGIIEDYFSDW